MSGAGQAAEATACDNERTDVVTRLQTQRDRLAERLAKIDRILNAVNSSENYRAVLEDIDDLGYIY